MMILKLLENKTFIRIFGFGLLIAPLFNILITMSQARAAPELIWTMDHFWMVLYQGAFIQKTLSLGNIITGLALLLGAKKAWHFVLALLSCYILSQLIFLGQNIRSNPVSIILFLMNVGLFLFIADQLVFKQKPQNPKKINLASNQIRSQAPVVQENNLPTTLPIPTNTSLKKTIVKSSKQKIPIQFEGVGIWAYLSTIDQNGIELKRIDQAKTPPNLGSRKIDFILGGSIQLTTQFAHQHGDHFFFEYSDLTKSKKEKLNQWLSMQTA